jgi:hypothetical protein
MKTTLGIVAALCVALTLPACGGESASYRHKLTLSINTPDGVKTAVSVVEHRYDAIEVPARGEYPTTKGQALYLDLGPGRRPLVALLTRIRRDTDDPNFPPYYKGDPASIRWIENDPQPVLGKLCLGVARILKLDSIGSARAFNAECRHSFSMAVTDLPDLVTFADVNDPKSVILVDPNDLAATLGPGVSWKSMTLQATDDPLTEGIEKRLPWLKQIGGQTHLDGSNLGYGPAAPIANRLQRYNFEQDY